MTNIRPKDLPRITTPAAGDALLIDGLTARSILVTDVVAIAETFATAADAVVASNASNATVLKANIASPTFTGTPAAPTPAVNTNTTQLATTAFVLGQAGAAIPLVDGAAAVGTATKFAREDHVHPSDTTRAPLASPALTGVPTAPTAANGTNTTQLATTAFVIANGGGGGSTVVPPQGRLTLTSGTPVMATSVTAATTLYYAPMVGKFVPINSGGVTSMSDFTASTNDAVGLSIVLGSNWAAGSNYDVFVALNGGVLTLATGPDWSAGAVAGSNTIGASVRGTGAGSTELQICKGFLTNKNSITLRSANATTFTAAANEATYLGTFRTGSAGQISFTYGSLNVAGTFNLWNAYNQVPVASTSQYDFAGAGFWTYSSATIRQANANAINQFNFVTGLAASSISASYAITTRLATTTGANATIGLALNSTTSFTNNGITMRNTGGAILDVPANAPITYKGQIGANFISANEAGDSTTTTTFIGSFSALNVSLFM